MLSFLRVSKPAPVKDALDENRVLLEECVALSPAHREEVADRLLVLWNCFVEEFGSPTEFHAQPKDAQDGYIAKFERVAARTESAKHGSNRHLHYSVALMLHFLRVARDGARQQSALDLSGRVAVLINEARERQIAARRSSIVDALSLSLLSPNPNEITEVVVNSPPSGAGNHPGAATASARREDARSERDSTATFSLAGESRAKRPRIELLGKTG